MSASSFTSWSGRAWQAPGDKAANIAGDALAVGEDGEIALVGALCEECETQVFPSTAVCPHCMNELVRRKLLSRTGKIYSYSTVHAGPARWLKPFVAAYVDLDDGVRVFSRLVTETPRCGDRVRLATGQVGRDASGEALFSFVFVPDEARHA